MACGRRAAGGRASPSASRSSRQEPALHLRSVAAAHDDDDGAAAAPPSHAVTGRVGRHAEARAAAAVHRGSPAGLAQALDDGVGHVVLQEGVYDLTSGMAEMCSYAMLCLAYAVTIEAEVAGTVVLNASRSNRVFYIAGTRVELVGLNITGGYKGSVSVPMSNPCLLKPNPSIPCARFLSPIHRPVELLTLCAVLTRRAGFVLAVEPSGPFLQRPVELLTVYAVLTRSWLVLAFEPSGAFFQRPVEL